MQEFALLAIALFANKLIELLKYIKSGMWNAAVTLLSLFVAGVVTLALAAHAAVTMNFMIPGTTIALGSLDGASIVLLGLMLTSTGSTVYDFKKAFDTSDSAKQPSLTGLGAPVTAVPPAPAP